MQFIIIMSEASFEFTEVEPVKQVQMNIYKSNTYRKDLSWLHFDDEPRVGSREVASEGPIVLHIHFCGLSNNTK